MKQVIFALLICVSPVLFSQTTISLSECLQTALDNNLQLRQGAASVEYSDKASSQSRLLLLPNLNGGVSYFWNFGYTIDPVTNLPLSNNFQTNGYQLTSSLSLYSGGSISNTIKKSKVDLQLASMNYSEAKDNVQFMVISAYLSVMFAEEQLKITNEKIKTTEAQLQNSQKLVAAGSLPEGNLLAIQAQLANDQLINIQAKNAVEKTYLDLKILLQMPVDQEIRVVYPQAQKFEEILKMPIPDANAVAAYAIEHKAGIKKYDYELLSNQYSKKIAAAAAMPNLSLIGQLSTNYSNATYAGLFEPDPYGMQIDNNLSEIVGVSLQIPIFNNGTVMINKQSADLTIINTELNKQIAINTMQQNVTQAINDLKAAVASYGAAKTSYDAAKTAFEFTEKKFNLGSTSSFDYTNSINNLAQAESSLVQAKYDLIFKAKIIDYYLDKPLDF